MSLVCRGHDVIMQTSKNAKPKSAQASKRGFCSMSVGFVCRMALGVVYVCFYTFSARVRFPTLEMRFLFLPWTRSATEVNSVGYTINSIPKNTVSDFHRTCPLFFFCDRHGCVVRQRRVAVEVRHRIFSVCHVLCSDTELDMVDGFRSSIPKKYGVQFPPRMSSVFLRSPWVRGETEAVGGGDETPYFLL